MKLCALDHKLSTGAVYTMHLVQLLLQYMQKKPPASSSDTATVLLSSDDESSKDVSQNVPARKRPQRKSVGRPKKRGRPPARVEKSKKLDEKKEEPEDLSSTHLFTKTYELRPTSRRIEQATKLLSFSDDEASPIAGSRVTKKSSVSTRMTLSESKFRKRLTDIQKGSILPNPTSTPFTRPSPVATTSVKTRLQFSSSRETRSKVAQKKRPTGTPTMIPKPPPVEEVTVAEESSEETDEDKHTPDPPPPEKLPSREEKEKEKVWPQLGWAEIAFATFITAVAAIGYYYSS